jgi:phenol 2-monooxygenase
VLGAFGLNASILDASNLAWKLGLAAKGLAKTETLLSTYTRERRKHAARIIRVSGDYLRFISGSTLAVPDLDDPESLVDTAPPATNGPATNGPATNGPATNGHATAGNGIAGASAAAHGWRSKADRAKDLEFIGRFFKDNGQFLLGVDCPYDESAVALPNPAMPVRVRGGVRAPNPRVCLSTDRTGYLYDVLSGAGRFHLVVFVSSLEGTEVRRQLAQFAEALADPNGFYRRLGGEDLLQVVLVVKMLPFEFEQFAAAEPGRSLLAPLLQFGSTAVVFDDRAPDEDAHTTWGVNHRTGAVAVIRPDLWVGMSCYPEETDKMAGYFEGFLRV